MHMVFHFIPWNDKACPVGTEHRTRRIFHIRLGIVADGGNHFLSVVTRLISF